MSYRDEREAVRLRVCALERELGEARAILRRLDGRTVHSAGRASAPAGRVEGWVAVTSVVAMSALLVAPGMYCIVQRVGHRPAAVGFARGTGRERMISTQWHAHVRRADGVALRPGTDCVLSSGLASDGSRLLGGWTTLTCAPGAYGATAVFESGASALRVEETHTPAGYRYVLQTGPSPAERADGAQIVVDGVAGLASVRVDQPFPQRVDLELEGPSDAWAGRPLFVAHEPRASR